LTTKKKSFYIGGTKHTIEQVDTISGLRIKKATILGQYHGKYAKIRYIKGLGVRKNSTILHELVHAIGQEYDYNLTEEFVDVFSREICGALSQLGMIQ
jgi:hypothetical protein